MTMQIPYSNPIKRFVYLSIVLFAPMVMISALTGCTSNFQNINGITKLASRGNPPAQSIAWSPTDENKILVISEAGMRPGPIKVYVLDTKTGRQNVIAKTEGFILDGKWLPDGKSAIFRTDEVTKGFEPQGWWLMNVDDKSTEYFSNSYRVSWAPNGKTVAIFSGEALENKVGNIKLQLINVDTNLAETIYQLPEAGFVSNPVWSPDGKYIAFSYGDSRPGDLFVINLETREAVKITENKLNDSLAWSPKGNIIALERRARDEYKVTIHLISADGKCDIEIPNLESVFSPTWSPDGEKLGYVGIDGIYSLDMNQVVGRDIYQSLCP
jgi:WD40 repeat protein